MNKYFVLVEYVLDIFLVDVDVGVVLVEGQLDGQTCGLVDYLALIDASFGLRFRSPRRPCSW